MQVDAIRRPLFDGARLVCALWFDAALLGEPELRRRVLRRWQAGARLDLVQGGYLLRLAAPVFAQCAEFDGLPFCEHQGVMSSAPLEVAERAGAAPGTIWLVRGARAQQLLLSAATRVEVAAWLDLRGIALSEPLRLPRQAAAAPLLAMPEAPDDVRTILKGKIPPASAARERFMRTAERSPARPGRALRTAATVAGALLVGPMGLLGLLTGMLFGRGRPAAGAAVQGAPAATPNWRKRLNAGLARLSMLSRVSKVIGWRQAAYLRKMVDLFERGELHDALRHAVPLDSLNPEARRQSLGAPRPRSSLDIAGPNPANSLIGLAPDLTQYLRQTYRRTYERLDREGKIDEAVFVLAELLRAGAEAVDYLENKGRMEQAARLSETMGLSADISVRLWCKAGDLGRALRLARLGRAFPGAVKMLERQQSPLAATLRQHWADDLAHSGDLVGAADAVWALPGLREQALEWLLQAERAGGSLGVRALLRKLSMLPDGLAGSADAISAVLDGTGEGGAEQRARMARELVALPSHSAATRRVAAALVRKVLPECLAGANELQQADLKALLELSDAAGLRADMPTLQAAKAEAALALWLHKEPVVASLTERGLLTIYDACRLPEGHSLLALGEGGVVRVDRRGRQLVHFPVPAHHLVHGENGLCALAVAQREVGQRVSRIDLGLNKVSDWITPALTFWAQQYDGVTWNAVIDNRLVAIDTRQDRFAVSWQIADLPGQLAGFAEDQNGQAILLLSETEMQQWRYALPARRLNQRDSFSPPERDIWQLLPNPGRDEPMALYLIDAEPGKTLRVRRGGGTPPFDFSLPDAGAAPRVTLRDRFLLVESRDAAGGNWCCRVFELMQGQMVAELRIAGAIEPGARLRGGHLLVFDRAGRLIDVDCATGKASTHILG
ncbi:hypothetical protein GTP91_25720 [Rugamonas sp. FT82W]|uniref:MoxR-vWA-beta-propeller ternary system domain-containing protein n=1 Tax=Duganella vulcania TaxID=2692166 RepID=A0A845GCC5_9BURK|nr:bpX6 domain-containing protein [Duganella vulcania]MYM90558.1 hypothetical protein [Duganella vulcania]